MDVRVIYRTCPACGHSFGQPDDPGRKRRFCSDACKQAAYRARKREREQARQRAEDDARRRAREDARRARDRTRRTPPPHAGTSRPGSFCGSCGGHRGPHTVHHDQAAHDRARRRYDGLHAKAQHWVPRGGYRLPGQGRAAPRQVRPVGQEEAAMPDRHRLSEPQARAHARAWLEQQHTDAHELLVTLLHYVPEPDRTRALRELSTGELRRLARLLADATDLRQVARAIIADLQHHPPAQQRPNGS